MILHLVGVEHLKLHFKYDSIFYKIGDKVHDSINRIN